MSDSILKMMKIGYQFCAYWMCLVLLACIFFIGAVACGALLMAFSLIYNTEIKRNLIRKVARKLVSKSLKSYLSFCQRLKVLDLNLSKLDQLNQKQQGDGGTLTKPTGFIVAANHPSMIDVVLILSRLDNCNCIVKQDLFNTFSWVSFSAKACGFISNRDGINMVKESIKALKNGELLLIFPEGTRTSWENNEVINPLHASASIIAKRSDVSIQMVYLHTNSRFMGRGHPIWRMPNLPMKYTLEIGPVIDPRIDVCEKQVTKKSTSVTEEMESHFRKALNFVPNSV